MTKTGSLQLLTLVTVLALVAPQVMSRSFPCTTRKQARLIRSCRRRPVAVVTIKLLGIIMESRNKAGYEHQKKAGEIRRTRCSGPPIDDRIYGGLSK